MAMEQTYRGYFMEDGRFIPDNLLVKLPVRRRVILNILDDESQAGTNRHQKVAVLDKIFEDARKAEHELSEMDWAEFENLRSQSDFTREINL